VGSELWLNPDVAEDLHLVDSRLGSLSGALLLAGELHLDCVDTLLHLNGVVESRSKTIRLGQLLLLGLAELASSVRGAPE
jgi:hypothetical protein